MSDTAVETSNINEGDGDIARGNYRHGKGKFNKGKGGFRGGRWGKGGGGGGRWGQGWKPKVNYSDGTGNDEAAGGDTGKNAFWDWCQENTKEPEEDPPFVFEESETDLADEFKSSWQKRQEGLIRHPNGTIVADCLGMHSSPEVCVFCEGKRGPWSNPDAKPDNYGFKRYQQSLLSTPFHQNPDEEDTPTHKSSSTSPKTLVPEENDGATPDSQ